MLHIPVTMEEPEVDDAVLREIGRIVLRWAELEWSLDHDIQHLRRHPSAGPVKKIPGGFDQRLRLWRRLVDNVYSDAPMVLRRAQGLYDGARALAAWRNNLNHGTLQPEESGVFSLLSQRPSGRGFVARRYRVTRNEILVLSTDIKRLSDEMSAFTLNRHMGLHRA